MCGVPFFADELNEFGIWHDTLVDPDRPWLRVRLWVIDGDVDLESAVVYPAESFSNLGSGCQWCSTNIQPFAVADVARLNDQRIPFPLSDGIAVPPGFDVGAGKWPSIHEDLTQTAVGFVNDQDHVGSLNHLSRLWMGMELHESHRQAMRIGVVLAVVRHALLDEFRSPGLDRQT